MTEAPARCEPGTPCWTSLMVHDLAATQDFYRSLFGWEFTPGPQQLGANVRAVLHGHEVAGISALPPERHLPVAWTTYLASDDPDDTAEHIRSCGGTVAVGPLDSGEAGRLLIASDPAGAVFGVLQGRGCPGPRDLGAPGSPVWHELITYETATIGKFYEAVFDYAGEPSSPADLDTLTMRLRDEPVVVVRGMGSALPRDRGPHWLTHFAVPDADEAAHRVVELGGHILRAPYDGATGRLATVADPEGAVFTVVRLAR